MDELGIDIVENQSKITSELIQDLADRLGKKVAPKMKRSATQEDNTRGRGGGESRQKRETSPDKDLNRQANAGKKSRTMSVLAPMERLENKGEV